MAQNEHLRESNELAELFSASSAGASGAERGVKQQGSEFWSPRSCPVLVEIGFGTNAAEAAYLTDQARMEELSAAISDAVLEYLKAL